MLSRTCLRRQQLARGSAGGQAAAGHLADHLRQQGLDLGVLLEGLFEPGVDALPHPRQRLVPATLGQPAIGGLDVPELRYRCLLYTSDAADE